MWKPPAAIFGVPTVKIALCAGAILLLLISALSSADAWRQRRAISALMNSTKSTEAALRKQIADSEKKYAADLEDARQAWDDALAERQKLKVKPKPKPAPVSDEEMAARFSDLGYEVAK